LELNITFWIALKDLEMGDNGAITMYLHTKPVEWELICGRMKKRRLAYLNHMTVLQRPDGWRFEVTDSVSWICPEIYF